MLVASQAHWFATKYLTCGGHIIAEIAQKSHAGLSFVKKTQRIAVVSAAFIILH